MRCAAVLTGLLLLAPGVAQAQRAEAKLACRFTGTDFVYDCTVQLRRGGAPLTGAQVVVDADMPSMPGMHGVAPAQATAGARPGDYRVTLDLEMTGEWAVRLRLDAPAREELVLRYLFDEKGARPAGRAKAR